MHPESPPKTRPGKSSIAWIGGFDERERALTVGEAATLLADADARSFFMARARDGGTLVGARFSSPKEAECAVDTWKRANVHAFQATPEEEGEFRSNAEARRLRATSLPADCTKRELAHVFRRFGYVDMAFVAPGVSVATFETPAHAAAAMRALRGYDFGGGRMKLAFAKPEVSFERGGGFSDRTDDGFSAGIDAVRPLRQL